MSEEGIGPKELPITDEQEMQVPTYALMNALRANSGRSQADPGGFARYPMGTINECNTLASAQRLHEKPQPSASQMLLEVCNEL